jgi:hypothetical protein
MLSRRPAETAVLLRPLAGQPALAAEALQPLVVFLLLKMLSGGLLPLDDLGKFSLAKFAHFGTKLIERCIVLDGSNEHGLPLSP